MKTHLFDTRLLYFFTVFNSKDIVKIINKHCFTCLLRHLVKKSPKPDLGLWTFDFGFNLLSLTWFEVLLSVLSIDSILVS